MYEAGYGAANLEADVPITPVSIFHAASVSKQFTATAVMLLVREGKLSLDADVRTYLPELPDYGHRITLRHLLTHTSGIRDQWDLLRDTALMVGRTSGPTLIPIAERRFWFPAQRTEWTFAPNGDLVLTFRGTPSRKPVTLVRRDAVRPTRSELVEYDGSYRSEELGATYVVSATDTAVTFCTGIMEPWTAVPAYRDTFLGQAIVEFTRDASGRVTGLLMTTGRVRKLRFAKTS